jgi:hypothetical protein
MTLRRVLLPACSLRLWCRTWPQWLSAARPTPVEKKIRRAGRVRLSGKQETRHENGAQQPLAANSRLAALGA